MTQSQKDLGFLLLVKYGREPFYFTQLISLRATMDAWRDSDNKAARECLYTDIMLNDGVIQRAGGMSTLDEQKYALTDKFLEEIKNEK